MSRAAVAGLAAVVPSALAVAPSALAVGQAPTPGAPATARLTGAFQMFGRVTVAKNIKGERKGQRAKRSWTFTSTCPTGQCQTVKLVRYRAGGVDRLTLRLRSPGHYAGTGMFYAPERCGGRDIRKGESVPFKITVKIVAAQIVNGADIGTIVAATYTNRSRKNLTRCVAIPGHDAAVYEGLLLTLPPPPSGGTTATARSPAGS